MDKKEKLYKLMCLGNNFLMRSINYLVPDVSLEYGLDIAVMLAILVEGYITTKQVHSLFEIDGRLYAKFNMDILNVVNIWSKERAIEIIEELILLEFITTIGYEKKEILIYYVS